MTLLGSSAAAPLTRATLRMVLGDAAGAVPGRVADLVQEVTKPMLLTKANVVTMALLALAVCGLFLTR